VKHVLDIPWGSENLKEKYGIKTIKGGYGLYTGVLLPRPLRIFMSEDFSIQRWTEDEINAHVSVSEKPLVKAITTLDQVTTAEKMSNRFTDGASGLVMESGDNDEAKITTLLGVSFIAKSVDIKPWDEGVNKGKLLIVTSKSSVAQWRKCVRSLQLATAFTRPLIIDYSQLDKLLMAPAHARITPNKTTKAKVKSKNGVPTVDWDFIIFDKAHMLGNPERSLTSANAISVARLNSEYKLGASPFTIFASESFSHNPLELTVMSNLLGLELVNRSVKPKDWAQELKDQGFFVYETPKGFVWLGNPPKIGPGSKVLKENEVFSAFKRDTLVIKTALKSSVVSKLVTEATFTPVPIALSGKHKLSYRDTWLSFQSWLLANRLTTDKTEYSRAFEEYSAKVSSLKNGYVLELVLDLLANTDNQVLVRVTNIETTHFLTERLLAKKFLPSVYSGTDEDRDQEALNDFHDGLSRVLIVDGLVKPDEIRVKARPKVIVTDAQLVPSFLKSLEVLLPLTAVLQVLVPYLEKTIEEKIIELYFTPDEKYLGKTISAFDIERIYRIGAASTLPPNRLS
jgi:hypothetical protein